MHGCIVPIDRINVTISIRLFVLCNKIIISRKLLILRFKTGIIHSDVNFLLYIDGLIMKFTFKIVRLSSEYKINITVINNIIVNLKSLVNIAYLSLLKAFTVNLPPTVFVFLQKENLIIKDTLDMS